MRKFQTLGPSESLEDSRKALASDHASRVESHADAAALSETLGINHPGTNVPSDDSDLLDAGSISLVLPLEAEPKEKKRDEWQKSVSPRPPRRALVWIVATLVMLAGVAGLIWRLLPSPLFVSRRIDPTTAMRPLKEDDNTPVKPVPLFLPPGFQPLDNEKRMYWRNKPYHEGIQRIDRPEVVFLFIQPNGGLNEAPFYLMTNKVCNGVFRAFVRAQSPPLGHSVWQRGGLANGQDAGSTNDLLPVLRVTRPEAEHCATWLGGRLPTFTQLDQALGYSGRGHHDADPVGNASPAINRAAEGPRPITADRKSIHDLAGNGREWTRDSIPLDGTSLAILRGRSYTATTPLRFADLDAWNHSQEMCPTQFFDHASPYTSFRVVLELTDSK
jgi:hypothetical protein